ncbi:MAG: sensor histidine kinase [Cyclobacteriaceae bacterium]
MSESSLKWIILLMSIALIGLVGFQLYWFKSAIDINEDQFKQEVQGALQSVRDKLEQQEVLFTAAKKLKISQGDATVIGLDSIRFISKNPLAESKNKIFYTDESIQALFLGRDTINLNDPRIKGDVEANMNEIFPEGHLMDEDVLIEIKRFKSRIDSIESYDTTLRSQIQKVQEKSQMVTVVLNELLSKERKIDNRITEETLLKHLRNTLYDRGIDIDFQFGVYDADENKILMSNAGNDLDELVKSEFKVYLFPRDIIAHSNYLMLHFPDQRSFLLGKIWVSLASSVVLMAIIIFCFAYAVYTILKQKKLSEMKNDFINNMTHEFKTPISTVSLACEALRDIEINADVKLSQRYLSIINIENQRLGAQVEKVLQIAQLEKNDYKLKIEQLDVHTVIDQALENIRLQIDKRSGLIIKNLKAIDSLVLADEMHLTNIIYNLLDNANKYSNESPEITISTENRRHGVVIEIQDKGIGMTKEVQSRIFDKFYRAPTGNLHDVKGFGLGLAYVKTMSEVLGGKVHVSSVLNKGSKFEVYLPNTNGKS